MLYTGSLEREGIQLLESILCSRNSEPNEKILVRSFQILLFLYVYLFICI